jgi:hypothetical protein
MAGELTFKQIAVAVTRRAGGAAGGASESLSLYGLTEDGAVYEYLGEPDSKVAGGGWKRMSMRELP